MASLSGYIRRSGPRDDVGDASRGGQGARDAGAAGRAGAAAAGRRGRRRRHRPAARHQRAARGPLQTRNRKTCAHGSMPCYS